MCAVFSYLNLPMYLCPKTSRNIRTSSNVEVLLAGSLLISIIFAANSIPVCFSMHRLTVELAPLNLKACKSLK